MVSQTLISQSTILSEVHCIPQSQISSLTCQVSYLGYRDAQVGWLDVREDEGQHTGRSKQSRTAQFLVIYAARRGLLEVLLNKLN